MLKKCVKRYCGLANKEVEQPYKVTNSCLDDHQFKQEELETVGELADDCSHIVLKCVILGTVLDDLTSCGQSTSLRDRSQNALRHVTNDWRG